MSTPDWATTLADMGIDHLSKPALAMLPVIEVAWADGRIQDKERERLLLLGDERFGLGEEGARLLLDWLKHRPTPGYFQRGREVLLQLSRLPGTGVDDKMVAEVLSLSRQVAKASGWWFFGLRGIKAAEAKVLASLEAFFAQPAPKADPSAAGNHRGRHTVLMDADDEEDERIAGVLILETSATRTKVTVTPEGLVVGRGPTAHLKVQAEGVADAHCRVFARRRRFYVEDLGTRTGTLVNGERVGERRLLGGERIRAGNQELVFKMGHRTGDPTLQD